MVHFVFNPGSGPFLDQGDIGFFVEVVYFAWVAILLGIASFRRNVGPRHATVRRMAAAVSLLVSVGFLSYHLVEGERLNWVAIGVAILMVAPIALSELERSREAR